MAVEQGITGGLQASIPITMTMVAFLTVALYNVIELGLITFLTFKRRRGLYFWSLLVATSGIAISSLGFIFKYFQVITLDMLSMTLVVIGWYCMVTGQSIVLYSRLHLIVRDLAKLRWILIMIITNAVIGHIPTTVFAYGSNSTNPGPYIPLYKIYEKVQITLFFIQETIISSLFVYETLRILKPARSIKGKNARKVMMHLIYVNIMVIILDITLLSTEFSGHYEIQTTYKPAVYSVKLKMEFNILNQLVEITKPSYDASSPYSNEPRSLETERSGRNGIRLRSFSNVGQVDPSQPVETKDDNSKSNGQDIEVHQLEVLPGKPKLAWTESTSGRLSSSSSEVPIAQAGSSLTE